jgi:hypothetical protein
MGCDAIRERLMPTEPTAATPSPAPITIPVILPTPAPTPVPVPTPAPAPNPTPTPEDPPPSGGSCGLPPSTNPNGPCTMGSNSFLGQVDRAITLVTQQQPGIFDVSNKICENCYYVKNPGKFTSAVVANLSAAGLCAFYDGEELGVKNSNSFNDQYDILVASGHIRRGLGSYRSTCRPAWF